MAIWTTDDYGTPDFQLIQNGYVHLFHKRSVLRDTSEAFEELGYRVIGLDTSDWTRESLHTDFARALSFPGYYGHNLDALNDCLSDVAEQSYGWQPEDTGVILVLDNIDSFWAREPEVAFLVMDIFSDNARRAALFGNRMMCLVRSDDPWFRPNPVGAINVQWNPAEWFTSSRDDGVGAG